MRKHFPLTLIVIAACFAIGAYLQALHYPFIYDDTGYVSENQKLANLPLSGLWQLFTEPYNDSAEFLPLRDLSYWIELKLYGLNPAGYRIDNILIYLLCLPLIYSATTAILRYFRTLANGTDVHWAAAAVTALFVLHPAHVEAVVWISGRKDLLSGLFSLLALWLSIKAKRDDGLSPLYASVALAALVGAMLSKASAYMIAPLIAAIWTMFWRNTPEQHRRRAQLLWPAASLLVTACLAYAFASTITSKVPLYFGFETLTRSLAVLGWLTHLSISPAGHQLLYPVFEDPYLPLRVALGIAALAGGLAGLAMFLYRRSMGGLVLTVFLLFCIPSLQLVPYALPSLVSDRFVFLAVWPVILLIVALSWHLRPVLRIIILLAVALIWSWQTVTRPPDWRRFETLIDSNLRAFPGYYMPSIYKATTQYANGYTDGAYDTARHIKEPELRDALIGLINAHVAASDAGVSGPDVAMARLQTLWLSHKRLPVEANWNPPLRNFWSIWENMLASEWIRLLISFDDNILVHYNAGLWMLDAGGNKNAAVELRMASESPRLPEPLRGTAYYNLGVALFNSGQINEAGTALQTALTQSAPDPRAHCLLEKIYQQTGRPEEAARAETLCHHPEQGAQALPRRIPPAQQDNLHSP